MNKESFYVYEKQYEKEEENIMIETNAERLKNIRITHFEHGAKLSWNTTSWIIEQAEQVQELENHNLKYFDMHKNLKGENKRLCEALNKIASKTRAHEGDMDADMELNDAIYIAKKALEVRK